MPTAANNNDENHLPQTGEANTSWLGMIGIALASLLGLADTKRKKRD